MPIGKRAGLSIKKCTHHWVQYRTFMYLYGWNNQQHKKDITMSKRFILAAAALMLAAFAITAQDDDEDFDFGYFRHYSLSVGVGSTGITGDVGTMIGKHLGMRLGIDYIPKISYNTKLDLNINNDIRSKCPDLPNQVEVKGEFENSSAHALLDIYPFNNSGFHVTVGGYFAQKDKVVNVYSEDHLTMLEIYEFNNRQGKYEDVPESYGQMALKLGKYDIKPEYNNKHELKTEAYINTKKFRPYAGLGFGRAVPGESRLNCQFDMGVQFWGEPEVYNGVTNEHLAKEEAKGGNGGIIQTVSKIKVFPVVSVRLSCRLF